jgi:hypothetical protein
MLNFATTQQLQTYAHVWIHTQVHQIGIEHLYKSFVFRVKSKLLKNYKYKGGGLNQPKPFYVNLKLMVVTTITNDV